MKFGLNGIISSAPMQDNGKEYVFRIGCGDNLLYNDQEDMRCFRAMTIGNTIVVGRKTYETMGSKPLPNRQSIILSSKGGVIGENVYAFTLEDIMAVLSLPSHMFTGNGFAHTFMIGGADAFHSMLPFMSGMYISEFYKEPKIPEGRKIDKAIYIPHELIEDDTTIFRAHNYSLRYLEFARDVPRIVIAMDKVIAAFDKVLINVAETDNSDFDKTLEILLNDYPLLDIPKISTFYELFQMEEWCLTTMDTTLSYIRSKTNGIVSGAAFEFIRRILTKSFEPTHAKLTKEHDNNRL